MKALAAFRALAPVVTGFTALAAAHGANAQARPYTPSADDCDPVSAMANAVCAVDGARISSRYGPRVPPRVFSRGRPVGGGSAFHRGSDYALPIGTPLRMPYEAIMLRSGSDEANGNYTVLGMPSGLEIWSIHLDRNAGLDDGTRVPAGSVYAYSGNTGRSGGPHLHNSYKFEFEPGLWVNINPEHLAANGGVNAPQDSIRAAAQMTLDAYPDVLVTEKVNKSGWTLDNIVRAASTTLGIVDEDITPATPSVETTTPPSRWGIGSWFGGPSLR